MGEALIDKFVPWGYFDGACQGIDSICGMGGKLYISNNHLSKFKANLGSGINNDIEFMVLIFLMKLALERGLQHLLVYVGSLLVIS